ncbi:unnamed protein product [Phytomonas sp. Hart1]|nr:unnamed protein product [Phytomonas sp. Hart1]|eukprot:CCW68280.1 unnamed protein product [Phytomonas sp. isolate Hart1]
MRNRGCLSIIGSRFRGENNHSAQIGVGTPKVDSLDKFMCFVINNKHKEMMLEHMKRSWLVQVVEAVKCYTLMINASGIQMKNIIGMLSVRR